MKKSKDSIKEINHSVSACISSSAEVRSMTELSPPFVSGIPTILFTESDSIESLTVPCQSRVLYYLGGLTHYRGFSIF